MKAFIRKLVASLVIAASVPVFAQTSQDRSLLFLQMLDQRITDMAWRIALNNTELCPQRTESIGVTVHNAAQYAPDYRQAAIETFGFGDGLPAALAVAKEGPAAKAGLQPDDRIATVEGQAMPWARLAPNAREDYASIDEAMKRLEALPPRPVALAVLRGDARITLTIMPRTVCRARVEVVPGAEVNANSNGRVVQIYGKLALWTKNDDELAIILSHELAHNILGHNARVERERIGTGLSAIFGRSGAKLRDMEREADRYGLYLTARAGYDYRTAPDLWRRLTKTTGLGGIWATTHPTARDRAAFNQSVVEEIDRKKATGAPLTP